MAQDTGTIVINPDGTVTDSDSPQARHDAAKAAVIRAEKINPPEPDGPVKEIIKPDAEQPKPQPVKAKPPVKKPAVVKESAVEADAPVKAASPKVEKSKKKTVAQASVKEKASAEASPNIKWNKPPKKKLKPVAVETVPAPVHAHAAPTSPISREAALRAAIQVAPPFKRSTVMRGNYQGKPVYEVILTTEEEGQETILVDAMTGAIVKGH